MNTKIMEGISQNQSGMALQGIKGKEAALQNRLRVVQQELNRLGQKDRLSREEQEKKQKLEKELMELQQQLSDISREKNEEMREERKRQQEADADMPCEDWNEEGKGEQVDERI